MTFEFDRIVTTLSRHGVAYVVIGGAAAVAHGSTLATEDIDLAPARDQGNLDRLGQALLELRAPAADGGRTRRRRVPVPRALPRRDAHPAEPHH